MKNIDGVVIKNLKVIPDERGWLMEILRCDDEIFTKFGQVYMSTAYPGVVKGWHYHKKQTDNFTCVHGMMKVVLYDSRKESQTFKTLMELFVGEKNPILISVPPEVYHGFKGIGTETAYFLSIPTLPYNYEEPDESILQQRAMLTALLMMLLPLSGRMFLARSSFLTAR
ncbi:MAG: dTDP-4-dehydrorhamnose 3,5-epimerase family protein [Candidatus Methanoperedens sp.]|nr:dTDP-4-dehydrorhamnose 3,5-epimerase family protein [Candidatus Methanoperedens sp.]